MIIALDQAIPYWETAFSEFGEIRPFSGRDLKIEEIRDADALIVRSVTPVRAPLLEKSSVRFVAAASAGIDHIDPAYLKNCGISFGYAAGCNANAVSEYIVTALHIIAARRGWVLKNKSIAIIGVGNVGSRVLQKARAIGMEVLLCDSPLHDLTGETQYRPFNEVLEADILSFHVPLTRDGPYPTWHMVDRNALYRLSPAQFLINSSRGAVFDNRELRIALQEGRIAGAVMDVWEEEPQVDYSLLELVDIGTPHLAGTTLDGKIRATEMVRDEFCRFFGLKPSGNMNALYPSARHISPEKANSNQYAILSVLRQIVDMRRHDADLRATGSFPAEQAAENFERLRTGAVLRPEFNHFIVDLPEQHGDLAATFAGLGFKAGADAAPALKRYF
jgi:erythronate-4-phosphate dehydrogenase